MYVIGITIISDFFRSSQHQSTNVLFFFSICPHDNYIYHKPQADLVSQKIGLDTTNFATANMIWRKYNRCLDYVHRRLCERMTHCIYLTCWRHKDREVEVGDWRTGCMTAAPAFTSRLPPAVGHKLVVEINADVFLWPTLADETKGDKIITYMFIIVIINACPSVWLWLIRVG